jgi:hypothetical protein
MAGGVLGIPVVEDVGQGTARVLRGTRAVAMEEGPDQNDFSVGGG